MTSTIKDAWKRSVVEIAARATDSNIGSATADNSASSLVSTLIPSLIYAGIFVGIFLILRRSQRRTYAPRTYLGSLRPQERTPELPNGIFSWIPALWKIPDSYVLNHSSLDGYLLLRFLKIATVLCFVGCLFIWPILMPVNATGGAGKVQLNMLSIANIGSDQTNRYYAHALVGLVYIMFFWFMITRELLYYINLRQAYLLSPLYAQRISSRTVLFSSVPDEYLQGDKIQRMFGKQLKNFWIAADVKELDEKVQEREKVSMKLEAAETKLITQANKLRTKQLTKGGETANGEGAAENGDLDGESGSIAARWLSPKKRPTHKLKFLIGKKVDTINWCRAELQRLNPEIEALQAKHRAGEGKAVSSIFVEFYTQADAQAAYQMVAHHQPLHMSPRFIGCDPSALVWSNLRIKWWERVIRNIATIAFVCALVIFWSIPVAVVGAISNINYLTTQLPWLSFINDIPSVILGVITGLLPSVALAVLMALLPIVLRLMAKLGGMPTLAAIELRTQNFYFAFQVVQVFLVATLTSAASSAVSDVIEDPSSAPSLLAESLPKSGVFYISYFILQGLAFSAGALLQLVGLILFKLLGKLLDKTPRKMYKRWSSLSGLGWGTVMPVVTNLTVIAIVYSVIHPLVQGFATIGLFLFWLAYRYNLLFVYAPNIDTQGLIYPRALKQVTTGIYLMEVCMIGLSALAGAYGPLVLWIIWLIFSVLFHVSLLGAIDPLLYYLPKSLEAEEEALLALDSLEGGTVAGSNGEKNGDTAKEGIVAPAPHKKPGMFAKWLKPHVYCDYATMRRLVPTDFAEIIYSPEVEHDAYFHPAVSAEPLLLWVPRDPAGISTQEVRHTSKVNPITDEGAILTEKGKIEWDEDAVPIAQQKIFY